jgi:hypothetical protein
VLGIALGLVMRADVVALLADLPRSAAFATLAFLALLTAFQLVDRSVRSFPFVNWSMHSRNVIDDPGYFA